jgi:hypothetical protein
MIRAQERLVSGVIAEYQSASVRAQIIKHHDIFAIMERDDLLAESFKADEIPWLIDLGAMTQQMPIALPEKLIDAIH